MFLLGKTYTMRGEDSLNQLGIIPRAVQYLLSNLPSDSIIIANYLQIYCESITDLLTPNDNTNIIIRETSEKTVYVDGLTEMRIQSINDLQVILQNGDKNRATSVTNMNLTSSRSHAILLLKVTQKSQPSNGSDSSRDMGIRSTLVLCDLAGSER